MADLRSFHRIFLENPHIRLNRSAYKRIRRQFIDWSATQDRTTCQIMADVEDAIRYENERRKSDGDATDQ